MTNKRQNPGKAFKAGLIKTQDNLCFYCQQEFGATVLFKNKVEVLRPESDHFIPRAYCGNDDRDNFVMACHICNRHKSGKVFKDVGYCVEYLLKVWTKFGGGLLCRTTRPKSCCPRKTATTAENYIGHRNLGSDSAGMSAETNGTIKKDEEKENDPRLVLTVEEPLSWENQMVKKITGRTIQELTDDELVSMMKYGKIVKRLQRPRFHVDGISK